MYQPPLFDRFRAGDEHAFNVFYDRYFPRLYLIIHAYVRRSEVAEDIVTNAFIKLYDCRARIRDPDHIYGFLFVVARNEAVGYFRDRRRERAAQKEQELLADTAYCDPVEAELEKDVRMTKINQLVAQLPPARRKIFHLHFFDGLSIREIAHRLNLTETTVRNQRNRALGFLRQALLL